MPLDELLENLVFSATWPGDHPTKREPIKDAVHQQARAALVARYGGALELSVLISLMKFNLLSRRLRESVEATAARTLTARWN